MSGYWTSIAVMLGLNVILAYAAFIPFSAGLVNLGTAGFMAIGAYASAYVSNTYGFPIVFALLLGAAVAGCVAFFISFALSRTKAIYLALATLALGECIRGTFLANSDFGGASGYPVTSYAGLPYILVAAICVIGLVYYVLHTRLGLCIIAVKDDERAADLLGVNVRVTQAIAFALGSGIAGLAGGLYAHQYSFIEPQYFNVLLSVYIILYVLLGGGRSVFGPLVGAAFFTLLPEVLRVGAEWRYACFGFVVIVLMAVRPEGLIRAGKSTRRKKQAVVRKSSTVEAVQ